MNALSSFSARRRRGWSLGAALLALAGCDISNCDDTPPAPSGQLDRIADLALVTPPTDGEPRSFLIAANPEIQQLRIFDVLEQRFVAAPNLYFPLSARTGPATSRLTVAPNEPRYVLALDTAGDVLQLLSVETNVIIDEDTVAPAFTTIGLFPTGRAPSDIAAWRDERLGLLALVTLPAASAVQVLALDVDAGTAL
ncbi:MAG: hypothetical protein ACO3JL_16840, partial [Myxococcota bacterium]